MKKIITLLVLLIIVLTSSVSCSSQKTNFSKNKTKTESMYEPSYIEKKEDEEIFDAEFYNDNILVVSFYNVTKKSLELEHMM